MVSRGWILAFSTLQDASPESPRALLFGDDAKTVLSFNGERRQSGFERPEIMCLRELTKSFDVGKDLGLRNVDLGVAEHEDREYLLALKACYGLTSKSNAETAGLTETDIREIVQMARLDHLLRRGARARARARKGARR